tara:strand:- start:567 stop:953 length:387 start_codon:yes stop_codon:yes gene_type:complete
MKRPNKFKTLAISGLILESLALSVHNPFFSILEPLSKAESFIYMLYIPICIISILACSLLLYKKLSGLYIARYSLSAILIIDFIDLFLGISYTDIYDYLFGIISLIIYGLVLKYWMKKEHLEFLSNHS